mgnify:CR=1 FL=1
MKLVNHREKKPPLLMIIPMIDIIFFLLVFFMMSMLNMVVQKTIPLNLPVASTAKLDPEKTLAVSVDSTGGMYLEDQSVTPEVLSERLAAEKANNAKLLLVLRGDEKAPYGRILSVIDIVKSVGIERVSVAAQGASAERKGE